MWYYGSANTLTGNASFCRDYIVGEARAPAVDDRALLGTAAVTDAHI